MVTQSSNSQVINRIAEEERNGMRGGGERGVGEQGGVEEWRQLEYCSVSHFYIILGCHRVLRELPGV